LWKRYLRFAAVIAAVFGTVMLTLQYFVLVPPFAWLARRAEKREPAGWVPIPRERPESSTSLY
jgi:riboflavin transporter FmnP